jgi:hypothetical protein
LKGQISWRSSWILCSESIWFAVEVPE